MSCPYILSQKPAGNGYSVDNHSHSKSLRVLRPESLKNIETVIYMHDGKNLFFEGGSFGSWNLEKSLPILIKKNNIKPILIVGIDQSSNRNNDYNYSMNDGKAYLSYIVNEVIPYIENSYGISQNVKNRYLAGSSMGAIISLSALADSNAKAYFNGIFALSPSLWLTEVRNILEKIKPDGSFIYIDSGTAGSSKDGLPLLLKFKQKLISNSWNEGKDLFHKTATGHGHSEKFWAERFPEAILDIQ